MREKSFLNVKVFFPATNPQPHFIGKASVVSSENKLGKFDILPYHINFITLIFKKVSILTIQKEKVEFQFERGVLIVRENEVKIFLGL